MREKEVMQKTFFHGNGTLRSRTFLPEKRAYGSNKVLKTAWLFRIHILEGHNQMRPGWQCATG